MKKITCKNDVDHVKYVIYELMELVDEGEYLYPYRSWGSSVDVAYKAARFVFEKTDHLQEEDSIFPLFTFDAVSIKDGEMKKVSFRGKLEMISEKEIFMMFWREDD